MNDYETDHWFDGRYGLLKKIRIMRCIMKMSDQEILSTVIDSNLGTPEQVWLCLNSSKILDDLDNKESLQ
jgi:hypothetical protein